MKFIVKNRIGIVILIPCYKLYRLRGFKKLISRASKGNSDQNNSRVTFKVNEETVPKRVSYAFEIINFI